MFPTCQCCVHKPNNTIANFNHFFKNHIVFFYVTFYLDLVKTFYERDYSTALIK